MPGSDRPSVGVAAVGKGVAVVDTLWIKGHKNNSKVAMLLMDEFMDFRLDRYVEQGSCCRSPVCKLVFPYAGTYLCCRGTDNISERLCCACLAFC